MKKLQPIQDENPLEKTIRPKWNIASKSERSDEPPRPRTSRGSPRKRSMSSHHRHQARPKSSASHKFELMPRPEIAHREQPVEDYSDLFDDNEEALTQRLGPKMVCSPSYNHLFYHRKTNSIDYSPTPPDCFTLRISQACHARRSHPTPAVCDEKLHHGPRFFPVAPSKDPTRRSRFKSLLKTMRRTSPISSVPAMILQRKTKAIEGPRMVT